MFELATSVSGSSNASLFETKKASSSPEAPSQNASECKLCVLASEIGNAPVPALDRYLLNLENDTKVLFQ